MAGEVDWPYLDELLAAAKKEVDHANGRIQKHAALLLMTQQYTVQCGAGRVTHCKSGKDRTGMSASLEQLVAIEHALDRAECKLALPRQEVLDMMRRHGVRRENVRLNTGTDRFAFNALQVSAIKEMTCR